MKSRLARTVGDSVAFEIYEALLDELLDRLEPLREEVSIEIVWTAVGDISGAELRKYFRDHELSRQSGVDLGERLQMAFSERIFFHEAATVIAIGVDDPSIDAFTLRNAFALLESCEWVIAPAADGGYRLIGCRAGAFRSAAFREIPWGTSDVLEETLRALRTMKKTFAVLPCRRDLDDAADLRALLSERAVSSRIEALARTLPPEDEGS